MRVHVHIVCACVCGCVCTLCMYVCVSVCVHIVCVCVCVCAHSCVFVCKSKLIVWMQAHVELNERFFMYLYLSACVIATEREILIVHTFECVCVKRCAWEYFTFCFLSVTSLWCDGNSWICTCQEKRFHNVFVVPCFSNLFIYSFQCVRWVLWIWQTMI
jgi:hypothetical protein